MPGRLPSAGVASWALGSRPDLPQATSRLSIPGSGRDQGIPCENFGAQKNTPGSWDPGARKPCELRLLQPRKDGLDRLEVGQVLGRGRLLGVLNDAVLVDDEGGAGRGVADPGEVGESHAEGVGDGLVEVGQDRDADLVFLGPFLLRERIVDADRVNGGAELLVLTETAGLIAHLLRAHAGVGQGEEEEDSLLLAAIVAQLDVLETFGGLGLEGRRLFAAAPALVNEDVLFMLPDDDWFKPNHVESLMRLIDAGNDWAYSLMSVYDQSGEFLFDDICECLGELHPSWNTGKGFAPTGSIAMKTSLYANLSNCYNYRGFGPDRVFYDTAKQFYPKFASSGLHTNCFRLGGNETSSSRQFFEHGNRVMMERYNGKMPWRK